MLHLPLVTPTIDKKRDDEVSWWPDWHEYSMDDNDTIIFCHRILFHPRLIPDKTNNDVVLWTNKIPLGDTKYVLVGPFNFATRSNTIRSN